MINLDQVRTLEWKVKQAVQLIVHLRKENDTLRGRLSDAEVRLQEMDSLVESFKATQSEMESGIRSALEELDHLEGGENPPSVVGSVDPLSYPPSEVLQASVGGVAEQEPVAFVEEVSAPETMEPVTRDLSFEEEYAALAAAEADSHDVFEETVPESVELEDSGAADVGEDSLLFESTPEPEPVVPEEKEPEQPGLGIF